MRHLAETFKLASPPIAGAGTLAVFLLDLAMPLGMEVWMLYLLPLLFILWGTGRRAYIALLATCTVLVAVGALYSPPGAPPTIAYLNRALGNAVMWIVSLFLLPWHRAEDALHESQRTMETLLSHLPGMVYRCLNEPHRPFLFASQGCMTLTGYSPAQLVAGQPHFGQLIDHNDRSAVWDQVQAAISAGTSFEVTYRIRTAAGTEKWLHEEGRATRPPDGRLLYLEGFISDITERKRAVTELQAAYQRLSFHVENSPLGVVEWGPDFRLIRWSPRAQSIFGWEAAEVLGRHPSDWPFIFTEDQAAVDEVMARLLDGREDRNVSHNRNYTKDGSIVHIEWYNSVLRDDAGGLVTIFSLVLDVTGQKRLVEQVTQAQKMEAIGRLAGGIAHDFNNLLTAINGYAELILDDLAPADPNRHALEQIQYSGERAAALTTRLLAFSRKQVLAPNVLDLNQMIANMETLLQRLIGEDIVLAVHLTPDPVSVKVDPGQLDQVLMNLVVNARDAMPAGGHMTIETGKIEHDGLSARTHADVQAGTYAMLAVSDTGWGMDRETQARIFEPFFTTKEAGKGTGLGLSAVYGIVKQSGGHILVDSEVGEGSIFKVFLPLVEKAPDAAARTVTTPDPRGSEVVLLVEDEDVVRELARTALEKYGYEVIEAADGDQALRVCETHVGSIHLLLTDTVMPRMNGVELARRVLARRADTAVLYMSGYADRGIVENEIVGAGKPFLQKPFTPVVLASKVREVLDATSPRRRPSPDPHGAADPGARGQPVGEEKQP